jgi:hypothetical protein
LTARDPHTGQFAFDGGFDRVCRCGHTLGTHVHGGFDCMNGDRGAPGADGTPCDCERFRERRVRLRKTPAAGS